MILKVVVRCGSHFLYRSKVDIWKMTVYVVISTLTVAVSSEVLSGR